MAHEHFDTIIVGAGSAGCVLANRLSQDPHRRILLIEAGPDYPNLESLPEDIARGLSVATSHDWGFKSEPGKLGRSIELLRGKLTGGSSAVNVTFAFRGWPDNYDHWAELDNNGWSFREILPYFIKLEHDLDFNNSWHGQTGPIPIRRAKKLNPVDQAFIESCLKCGYRRIRDHNQPGEIGVGEAPTNTLNGIRQSTALTYLAQARSRSNLYIKDHTQVNRVLFQNRRASGVQISYSHNIYADQIILAAGSYGSPCILQRSGIGDTDYLSKLSIEPVLHLPGVGEGLTEHPFISIPFSCREKITPDTPALQTLLSIDASPFRYHIMPAQYPMDSASGSEVDLYGALLNPRSRGSVRIKSPNLRAKPHIDLGLLTAPEDLNGLNGLVREIWRLSRTSPLDQLIQPTSLDAQTVNDDKKLKQFILNELDVYHHPVSTCRMGVDHLAVVNENGQVKGLDNLWVIDASIMPQTPSSQTNLPTIMIAERCVEFLKKETPDYGFNSSSAQLSQTASRY